MKYLVIIILALGFLTSCANKKEILYLQNAEAYDNTALTYSIASIQPNDILRITVSTIEPEAAIPYNRTSGNSGQNGVANLQILQLEGYIVNTDYTIDFPQLGLVSAKDKTPLEFQQYLKQLLEEGGHLKNPNINVRLINARFTILGEVNNPGMYTFTEQNITLLQALGYAGDLNINGKREDVMILRELDSQRQVAHIDLTSADLFNSPFYQIKPNDVIIVNPNEPKIKSSGFIGNVGSLLSVVTIVLSAVILITR